MKTVNQMLIFDVDGVITDPQKKKVTEPKILDEIINRLKLGKPVALNTGRSLMWTIDRVINPLLAKVNYRKILQNLFISGEMGATWIIFNDKGDMQYNKDNSISVPKSLQEKVRKLIETKYSDAMFYDESKETMISTEINYGYPFEKYKKLQNLQDQELRNLVEQGNLSQEIIVDPTTIATNVQNKFVGKHYAIRRMLDWVKKKGIEPQKYITFGDSFKSDIPMAEKLNSHKLSVEFVYVGEENINISKYPFPIKITQNKFEKGTLEFLKIL